MYSTIFFPPVLIVIPELCVSVDNKYWSDTGVYGLD